MLVTTQDSTKIWSAFPTLSDTLRIKIIELLSSQELCVCELCEQLEVSHRYTVVKALTVGQSKLSFHFKNLKEANLIRSRQQGRIVLT